MTTAPPTVIGRYALYDKLASGGMGSVYVGRQLGLAGFARTVAIKRLHPHLASDPELVASFLDEARIAARIRHPNVVATLDVVAIEGELILIMDYIHGEALSGLLKKLSERGERLPLEVVSTIIGEALYGLHAAHEATRENGDPLGIVHRDISPHNLLVGVDGVTRVVDFGVAKAHGRLRATEDAGALKGKLAYMAPEQLLGQPIDRRADIYAMGVVLWETLAARRFNDAATHGEAVHRALSGPTPNIRDYAPNVPDSVVEILAHALARDPDERFSTASAMAHALGKSVDQATPPEVSEWVTRMLGESMRERSTLVASVEASSSESLANIELELRSSTMRAHGAPNSRRGGPSDDIVTEVEPRSSASRGQAASPASVGGTAPLSTAAAPPNRWTPVLVSVVLVLGGIVAILLLRGPRGDHPQDPRPLAHTAQAPSTSGQAAVPPPALAPSTSAHAEASSPVPPAQPPRDAGPKGPATGTGAPVPPPKPVASAAKPPAPSKPCEYYENGILRFNPDCK